MFAKLAPGPSKIVFILAALLCLWPQISPAAALIGGILFGLAAQHPFLARNKQFSTWALQAGVVGLGASTQFMEVIAAGSSGVAYTAIGIAATMALGLWLGGRLGNGRPLALLISVGTAICGGSAIAATAATIRAKSEDISMSLAVVFLLNGLSLLIFPPLGRALGLSETQFGLWAALAIHDTSSVVGAALSYGPHALALATTVKLARALWIVPVALLSLRLMSSSVETDGERKRAPLPWFILGFIAVSALVSFVPGMTIIAEPVSFAAKRLLVLALFLIGSGLNARTLRATGGSALALGATLWVVAATGSLALVWYLG